jgi:hypothetical protein
VASSSAKSLARKQQRRAEVAARPERPPWVERVIGGATVGLIGVMVTGVLNLGSTVVDHQMTPATTDTVTTCTVAQQGVQKSLEIGLDHPESLEPINSEEVDSECGEEIVIACDILNGLNGQIPANRAAAAERLRC